MIEKLVKIYTAQHKPEVGKPIVFKCRDGNWCIGTYAGDGKWLDESDRDEPPTPLQGYRTRTTNEVLYWHYVIELE